MSIADILVPSPLEEASSDTHPFEVSKLRRHFTSSLHQHSPQNHHHRSLPSSRSPSRTKLAYPDSDHSDTDCDCDPATVKAVKNNASKRRVSASALLSGLRKEEIQHLLFCPGGSRSAAAAAAAAAHHQRKIRSYSSSQLTAMSPAVAKSANAARASSPLFPSPSSSFTPPPALQSDEQHSIASVLNNAKTPASPAATQPPLESTDDKENSPRSRRNSSSTTGKRPATPTRDSNELYGRVSTPSSRRSSVVHPSSPANLRGSKSRRSRPVSITTDLSAAADSTGTNARGGPHSLAPKSPRRPLSEYSALYGSSADSHTYTGRKRVPLADSRRNSGYSASSSTAESPASTHAPLPCQPTSSHDNQQYGEGQWSLSISPVADPAATPRRRSIRRSTDPASDMNAAYLDLPSVAPELVSASSDSTLTATLMAALPVVKIRDFAFPDSDPRHVGEPAEIQPIEIPASPSGQDSPWRSGYLTAEGMRGDPSAAILSSSSSSSLSSSFTPPPFGSFGFGNPYHYSTKPGGVTQGNDSPRPGEPGWSPQWQQQIGETSSSSSKPSTSKYSWGFVTDNTTDSPSLDHDNNDSSFSDVTQRGPDGQAIPSILMGSGLSTSEFHEFDTEGDEEEEDGANQHGEDIELGHEQGSDIPTGGLLFRAVYPFTAEAPQEMNLREGDFVRVYEQLCDGWVVAGKVQFDPDHTEEEVETGLIPQNYIVLVQQQEEATPLDRIQETREGPVRGKSEEERV